MKISKQDYYAVKGLFHLALQAFERVELYETELNRLLGEEENGSHASDAIYCREGIDEALEKMGIEVEEL